MPASFILYFGLMKFQSFFAFIVEYFYKTVYNLVIKY